MAATATVAARKYTVQDYIDLPEDGNRYELIDGELTMAPSPDYFHQKSSHQLDRLIGNYLDANPIGEIFTAPFDVYLGTLNAVQPDLVYISNENRSVLRSRIHGTPDLVIEILSPSNAQLDLGRKRQIYQEHRVREIWYIYPQARKIAVERLDDTGSGYGPKQEYTEDSILTTPLMPGLELSLANIFKLPGVSPASD